MKTLIITGGFMNDKFAINFINEKGFDKMIAGDSGMEFFYRNNLVPDMIVGDFDSAKSEIVSFFKEKNTVEVLHFQPEKDETDTELALKTALKDKPDEIYILGATGSRIDHMIGNIYLLQKALLKNISCYIVDEHNKISLIKEKKIINAKDQYGDFISLLPLGEKVTGVTLEGFKYPLDNHTLTNNNSLGVSNELVKEQGTITLQEGIILMIDSKD